MHLDSSFTMMKYVWLEKNTLLFGVLLLIWVWLGFFSLLSSNSSIRKKYRMRTYENLPERYSYKDEYQRQVLYMFIVSKAIQHILIFVQKIRWENASISFQ